jgi:uncharacterized membrane protein
MTLHRLILPAIVAVALAIRLAGLQAESYTMDEVTEWHTAALPPGEIVMLPDGFPPAYHLLLKGWHQLGGGPESGRWLSALLGLVTIIGGYRLGEEVGGRGVGLATAALLAISPLHVWFAQEARAYALVLPLATLALWLFVRAMRTDRLRDWLAYGGAALAGLYTHYYLAQLVALNALWLAPGLLAGRRTRWPSVAVHAGLAVLVLPCLAILRPDVTHQSGTQESAIGLADLVYSLYAFLAGFSTGLSLRDLHGASLREAVAAFLPWMLTLAACLALLAPGAVRSARRNRHLIAYLLYMASGPLLLSALAAVLLALKYKVSYVAWASVPLVALVGLAIGSAWDRRATRLAAVAYLALAATSLANRHLVDRYRTEDMRSVATHLTRYASRDTPVLVIDGYMAEPLRFYLGDGWQVRGVEAPEITAPRSGGWWVVYTRAFHGDPEGTAGAHLAAHARLEANFPGVALYRSP